MPRDLAGRLNTVGLSERQKDALLFAYEHGYWLPFGRGSRAILRGLVKRGMMVQLVNTHSDVYDYAAPAVKGELTEEARNLVGVHLRLGVPL